MQLANPEAKPVAPMELFRRAVEMIQIANTGPLGRFTEVQPESFVTTEPRAMPTNVYGDDIPADERTLDEQPVRVG